MNTLTNSAPPHGLAAALPPEAMIDREYLQAMLGALEREMRRRVAREEGRGGLFAFVCCAAPRYVSFIETLRTEHRDLMGTIATLRHRATEGEDLHALAQQLEELLARITEHEELEREVLRDALEP